MPLRQLEAKQPSTTTVIAIGATFVSTHPITSHLKNCGRVA